MKKKLTVLLFCVVVIGMVLACGGSETTIVKNDDYVDVAYAVTIGDMRNNESLDNLVTIYGDETAKTVKVLPIENLNEDFANGVDVSSIIEVEKNGGVFYNAKSEEQDVFEILKASGINYVRFRHWNNPKDPLFETPFGGGNNDLSTNIAIAKRAKRVGMKLCLDFHYSDFWADPEVQALPYDWAILTQKELEVKIYEYTKEVLEAFEAEGVIPHSVQIGNEINNGMMGIKLSSTDDTNYQKLANLLIQANKAVKDVSKNIQTIVHLAEGASLNKIDYFYEKMQEYEVDYDIIGLSYYSYWHGALEDLQSSMNALAEKYNKPIMIMEYSYGFTDKAHENASNIYSSSMEKVGGYGTSIQGQASYIRDVIHAVNSIPNKKGIGAFYWEPAWLPVANAGWASDGVKDYLESNGKSAVNLNKVTWANQALFSYSGKVLPSLRVYNEIKIAESFDPDILEIETVIDVTINIAKNETLPSYVTAYTELHSYMTFPVGWNQSELDSIVGPGTYVVNGTVSSKGDITNIICNVQAIENFVINNSFEDGGRITADVTDFSKVNAWNIDQSKVGNVKIQGKDPKTGFNNANLYSSSKFDFNLSQDITGLENGRYKLSVWIRSEDAKLPTMTLYATSTGTETKLENITCGSSWAIWVMHEIEFNVTDGKTTIGIRGTGAVDAWAHIDDFVVVKM